MTARARPGQGVDRGSEAAPLEARFGAASNAVRDEFERFPSATWIARSRRLSDTIFARLARRLDAGLRFGVAARLEDRSGRILLVRMAKRHAWTPDWMVPGGGAEPGETPRHAVNREIHEETGGRAVQLALWKVYHETLLGPRGRSAQWEFLQYVGRWGGGVPRPRVPEEIEEARWFRRLPSATAFRSDWLRPPRNRRSSRA